MLCFRPEFLQQRGIRKHWANKMCQKDLYFYHVVIKSIMNKLCKSLDSIAYSTTHSMARTMGETQSNSEFPKDTPDPSFHSHICKTQMQCYFTGCNLLTSMCMSLQIAMSWYVNTAEYIESKLGSVWCNNFLLKSSGIVMSHGNIELGQHGHI